MERDGGLIYNMSLKYYRFIFISRREIKNFFDTFHLDTFTVSIYSHFFDISDGRCLRN